MTASLSRYDLALFPGPAAVPHASSAQLLLAALRNPYLPSQLSESQLHVLVDHIKQFPRMCPEVVLIHLRCLHQLKQWAEMVSVSSAFLKRYPTDATVRQLRAQAYFECQDWNAYILDCNRVMDEHHPDHLLLKQRCYAYYKSGMVSDMLQDVRKIVDLSASLSLPEYRIERDLDPANPAACLRAQAVLIRYFPYDLELVRSHARLLFYAQKWDQLLLVCTMWQIGIAPHSDPELVGLKLHACVCLKAWKIVIEETSQILRHFPGDVSMLTLRAKAHAMHGNLLHSLRDNMARSVQ